MHGIGFGRWMVRLAAVALMAASASALAQDAPPAGSPPPDKAWAGGWKNGVEEGAPRDEVSGETMVVAAYGVLWLILILFVLRAQGQVAALRRESAELKALVEARLPPGGTGASTAGTTAPPSH
jgi:hypothetical protein